ncbi:MAG: hypothetical protein ACYDAJ_11490 [Nitrosotalea sp.]
MKALCISIAIIFVIAISSINFVFADVPPLSLTQIELNATNYIINDPNKICHGFQGTDTLSKQWVEFHNNYDTAIYVKHVKLFFNNPPGPLGGLMDLNFYLPAHFSCMLVLQPINHPFIQNTTNVVISLIYQYGDKNYSIITSPLTDNYGDSRTWQYNGTQWVFTDKIVTVPEFSFTIPILLVGITSLIVLHKIKSITRT